MRDVIDTTEVSAVERTEVTRRTIDIAYAHPVLL